MGGAGLWGKFFDLKLRGAWNGPSGSVLSISDEEWKTVEAPLVKQVCSYYYSQVGLFLKSVLILGSPHLSLSLKN